MGCDIPRPTKRPPTPPEKEIMEKAINEPLMTPNELRKAIGLDPIDEPVLKAFDQFHQVAHDLTYDKPRKEHVTNCPNCCAPITGPICEYCGTRFPDLDEKRYTIYRTIDNQEIIIPVYIGNQQIDEVVKGMKANPARFVDSPELPIQEQR